MSDRFNKTLDVHQAAEILQSYGIRPTPQRLEVMRVLFSKPQHLNAEQVFEQVNKQVSIVSKATIYNTLNLFAEKGLINRVIIDSSKVFFDSNNSVHHHLYNEDTGELQDIDVQQVYIKNLPELPAGTYKSGVDVLVRVKNK